MCPGLGMMNPVRVESVNRVFSACGHASFVPVAHGRRFHDLRLRLQKQAFEESAPCAALIVKGILSLSLPAAQSHLIHHIAVVWRCRVWCDECPDIPPSSPPSRLQSQSPSRVANR